MQLFQKWPHFLKFNVPTGTNDYHGPHITHLYQLAVRIQKTEAVLEYAVVQLTPPSHIIMYIAKNLGLNFEVKNQNRLNYRLRS